MNKNDSEVLECFSDYVLMIVYTMQLEIYKNALYRQRIENNDINKNYL